MKTSIFKYVTILIAIIVVGCDKSDEDDMLNSLSPAQVTELNSIATSGTWTIAYYFDTDKEETDHFNGYEFSFNSDGTLTATDGVSTINGTWSVTDSDDSDDVSDDDSPDDDDDVDFNIAFSSPADFADLTDDWDIVDYTSVRIELIDISGGNGGTDKLVFEKN
ncbi:hypothetical protein [Flagellimonas okinawensis]|uniref:Lipocalin-like domain-containing protein n=1 Tax=Flagellimonas okinawensis TaxID=3031324 RepID=A0ABT5XLE8_9FLAO|nr:hypothetical protein [[Muricauda] okinawensis]MDF0706718.1 hypothetical protein [[Muricauda] okinawensis]